MAFCKNPLLVNGERFPKRGEAADGDAVDYVVEDAVVDVVPLFKLAQSCEDLLQQEGVDHLDVVSFEDGGTLDVDVFMLVLEITGVQVEESLHHLEHEDLERLDLVVDGVDVELWFGSTQL